jgi:protein-S-isoprenylcysteine O-methyltransferase Ste14
MSTTGVGTDNRREGPPARLVIARVVQTVVIFLVMGVVLFLGAGRLDWWQAWIFLGVYFAVSLAASLAMLFYDPDLSQERSRPGKNVKGWDQALVALNLLLTLALFAVIGIDAGRFGWSRVPLAARLLALLGFIPGFGLPLWASLTNTFLSSRVRIQDERGHQAVTTGPYALVRHPMYLGMILYDLCLPVLLGSWWALGVGALMIIGVVIRTSLEDRTLRRELPGYAEYSRKVPYRLLPGVW